MELGEIWGYTTDRLYTTEDFDSQGKLKNNIPKMEGYNPNPGDILYVDFDGNGIINNGKNTSNEPRRYSILSVMILADISTEFVVAQHGKVFHCHLFYKESANGIFGL